MTAEPVVQAGQEAPSFALRGTELVQDAGALLAAARGLSESASADWQLLDLADAVEAASLIEDLSRITHYLQVVLAGAVDGHQPAAVYGVPSDGNPGLVSTAGTQSASSGQTGTPGNPCATPLAGVRSSIAQRRFREFRSTADFLRARLRISRAEARRRLGVAAAILPSRAVTGPSQPPLFARVADASADGLLSAAGAELMVQVLEEAQPRLQTEVLDSMEQQLADVGARQDHDFLVRTAQHWLALLDQDKPPGEEELARFQGVFPGRRKNGLNHLHVYCSDEQYEALTTAMSCGANPRTAARGIAVSEAPDDTSPGTAGPHTLAETRSTADDEDLPENGSTPAGTPAAPASFRTPGPSRPQQLLEGLLRAIRAGLASGGLPAAGGLRPQVMVTISHATLLAGLNDYSGGRGGLASTGGTRETAPGTGHGSAGRAVGTAPLDPGTAAFSGPIAANDVRMLACDADLIPAVLGSAGQVLDLGRATRLFPPHLRKALHARDHGCTFPGCTVPGPWTEAHHVTFWEHGGGTGIGNGALLCSFHHHLVHQGNWQVFMRSGIPWFRPPAYVDPDREPMRNTYFHPGPAIRSGPPDRS